MCFGVRADPCTIAQPGEFHSPAETTQWPQPLRMPSSYRILIVMEK